MKLRQSWQAAVVGALLSGCTASADLGRSAGALDCAWLASDNCYKATVTAASACVPGKSPVGALSADGTSCTFATGQVVAFDSPVTPGTDLGALGFTLTSGGHPCMTYRQSPESFELTTAAGTVSLEATAGRLTCPSGEVYESANARSILSCDGGLLEIPGGLWLGLGATQTGMPRTGGVSFALVGTSPPGGLGVFTCER